MADDNEPINVLEAVKDHVSQGHTVGRDRVPFLVDTFGVQETLTTLKDSEVQVLDFDTLLTAIAKLTSAVVANTEEIQILIRTQDTGIDVSERIQQQLAMINEGENLKPGERHYG